MREHYERITNENDSQTPSTLKAIGFYLLWIVGFMLIGGICGGALLYIVESHRLAADLSSAESSLFIMGSRREQASAGLLLMTLWGTGFGTGCGMITGIIVASRLTVPD